MVLGVRVREALKMIEGWIWRFVDGDVVFRNKKVYEEEKDGVGWKREVRRSLENLVLDFWF